MSYDRKQTIYRIGYAGHYQGYKECTLEELFHTIKADSEIFEIELMEFYTDFEPMHIRNVTESFGVISGKALISIGLLIISSTLKNNSTSDIFTSEASNCLCMIGNYLEGLQKKSAKTMTDSIFTITDSCLNLTEKYPRDPYYKNDYKRCIASSIYYLLTSLNAIKDGHDGTHYFRSSMVHCLGFHPTDVVKKESEKLSEIVLDFLKSGKHLFMV